MEFSKSKLIVPSGASGSTFGRLDGDIALAFLKASSPPENRDSFFTFSFFAGCSTFISGLYSFITTSFFTSGVLKIENE